MPAVPSRKSVARQVGRAVDPSAAMETSADMMARALANLTTYEKDARGAYSPATERAFKGDTALFTAWCSEAGRTSLPADPETVVAFIDHQALTKKPATIRRYVSSIAHLHRAADVPNPCERQAVYLALKRMSKTLGVAQKQAPGLTREDVDKMLAAGGTRLQDLRNRALLAVAYDTLARRSELVALRVEDLRTTRQRTGTITIRRSKTDQLGAGFDRYLARDTVQTVLDWTQAGGVTEGELFRAVLKGSKVGGALDVKEVNRIYRRMALEAELNADVVDRISAHSTRVGAARDMDAADIGMSSIMTAGGWKTPEMVARYVRDQEAARGGSARLAQKQGREN